MKDDLFFQGYAAALAAMVRVSHDGTAVALALISNGFTLKMLADAGANAVDVKAIRRVLDFDSDAARRAIGAN